MPLLSEKIKFFHQLESIDCGPACLAMVCSYYKKNYSVEQIKKGCAITRMGVSVHDIAVGAKKIGFDAKVVRLTPEQLEQVNLPVILFWKQDHFIVLYDIKTRKNGKRYYLADPGYGRLKLEEDIVMREWMGVNEKGIAIMLQPEERPTELQNGNGIYMEPEQKQAAVSRLWQLALAFFKEHKFRYSLLSLLLVAGLIANWAMPVLFQRIIDEGIVGKSLHIVWWLLLAQLALFLGNFVSESVSQWMLTRINFRLSIRLKKDLLYKLMRLPASYFDTRLNTDTLQRLGDQVKIQNFLTWKGLDICLSFLNIIVFSIILLFINRWVFFIYLFLSVASIVWVALFLKLRRVLEYALFLRQSENSNNTYEFIMHMPEIKVNNAQEKMIDRMITVQDKLNHLQLRSLFLNMYQMAGVRFFSKFREIITIALCAYFIINNQMTLGMLLSISYILGQLSGPLQNLITLIRDTQDAQIAQKRVNDVYSETDENDGTKHSPDALIDEISLSNIVFKYPGSFNPFVINDISFTIPRNKITAIVGQSGSGKTTLLKLLLSYYRPTSGSILLNDTPLSAINADEWRQRCGIVLQDGHIFSGTIADNIALADPDPDLERIRAAAETACIADHIEQMPLGYNTKVGNIGIQLSGGQKQRILIARAVYKDPDFIFLDEATSSLDANNEASIMNNLGKFFRGKTVLVIAHRLSTVKNADQIIVMDNGSIVETGHHESLASKKGHYYTLVKNQLELGT